MNLHFQLNDTLFMRKRKTSGVNVVSVETEKIISNTETKSHKLD